jgi:hypothetical protein
MRQADGSELLGANDPRAAEIGVIYVAPSDDRKDVLTAILTQEKLGRKQIVIELPEQSETFQRPIDFDGLKMRRGARAQLVFIVPSGAKAAEYARQRRFPVYSSLDSYIRSLNDPLNEEAGRRGSVGALPVSLRRILRLRGGGDGREARRRELLAGRKVGRGAPGSLSMAQDALQEGAEEPSGRSGWQAGAEGGRAAQPEQAETPGGGPATAAALGAGALAGAAAGWGWSAMEPEREETHAEQESPLPEVASRLDEEEEELPPFGARKAPVGGSGGPAAPAAQAGSQPAGESAAAPQPPVSEPAEAEDAVVMEPPRAAPPGGGPRIIPLARRKTDKLPAVSNAFAPDVGASARRGGAGRLSTAATAGIGAGLADAMATGGAASASGAAAPPTGPGAPGVPMAPGVPPMAPFPPGGLGGGRRRRGRVPLWLALVALVLLTLLVGCGLLAYTNPSALGAVGGMLPFGTPAATVTVTPQSLDLKNQYLITGVTGTPDAAQRQVQARLLTASEQAQPKTVPATGHGMTPAVQAKGTITFTHTGGTWESVLSGTTFPLQNGLKITTDETVSLPPVSPGQTTSRVAPAHVVQPGSAGNLPAGVISNQVCCGSPAIFATSGPFTGGQDPQPYTYVQQSDIDGVVKPVEAGLLQQAQQDFRRQLRSGEQLVNGASCAPTIKSDHQVGDRATSVTVTVIASCTGEVYDAAAALRLGQSLLTQEATKRAGSPYALVGQVVTSISGVTVLDPRAGTLSITVSAEGIWAYHFSDAQKEALARLIAGKSKSAAAQLLQQQPGVRQADIRLLHTSDDLLPADPGQISMVIATVPGLRPQPSPGASPTITTITPTAGASATPATTAGVGKG